MSRDELRAKIFAPRTLKREIIPFFGVDIELRQPTLGDILAVRDSNEKQSAIISILMDYAHIPGTDEKVFESGDAETLMAMPWGADFTTLNNALERLTEVNFSAGADASKKTPGATS